MQQDGWLFPLDPVKHGVPPFQEVLTGLRRVPAILWGSLEAAAYKVRSYRDVECPGEQLDGGLSASIFRHHALRGLKQEGIAAQQDEFTWTFDRLPFMGISFFYERYHVRVLKGRKGLPPGCGRSKKKKQFYGQEHSWYLENGKAQHTKLNLIGLWDFDFHYGLSNLWLACPAFGAARPEHVRTYWLNAIPHPEVASVPVVVPQAADSDLDNMIRLIGDDVSEEAVNER